MANRQEDTDELLSLDVLELRSKSVEFTDTMKRVYMACVKWRESTLKHATTQEIASLAKLDLLLVRDTLIQMEKLGMLSFDSMRGKVGWTRKPRSYLDWMERVRSFK